ncbi:MAG: HNH endonuclease [Pseudonocardia sp.]|nr:HNH endonuclease [Pseudonocardia sp.]
MGFDLGLGDQQRPWPREGIEIRVGLATLLGLDNRPGEIPRLGPVLPDVARDIVTAQHRGAEWRFAIVDTDGYLLLGGLTRQRPRPAPGSPPPGRCRGGIVEIQLTAELLDHLTRHPLVAGGAWARVIADLVDQYAHRDHLLAQLDTRPDDRFARGALARHIQIRDRTCVHPGCMRPAACCDMDHVEDYAHGGLTIRINIGPECGLHHPYKDRGWRLTQPEPGIFRWASPLGRIYVTRGEPVMPPLPKPRPRPTQPHPNNPLPLCDDSILPPTTSLIPGPEPEPPPQPDDPDPPPF